MTEHQIRCMLPADAHNLHIVGLAHAEDWTTEFARHIPARTTYNGVSALMTSTVRQVLALFSVTPEPKSCTFLPTWFFMQAKVLIDAHRAVIATTDPDIQRRAEALIGRGIHRINERSAVALGVAAARLGVGELVAGIARSWITYARSPHDDVLADELIATQNAYSARVERFRTLWVGGA
ncbi:hypothetical protein [Nocardia salmonicida]|uniref:hypothetical protein n=1 Tax=Nocardia salmonicida TaxID=53431 RepID=UPI0007A46FE8|nr:hypothetical protein [Nocardia salmonicida]